MKFLVISLTGHKEVIEKKFQYSNKENKEALTEWRDIPG
jgi:hypothetical protein